MIGDSNATSPVNVTRAAYGMANFSLNLFSGFKVKYAIGSHACRLTLHDSRFTMIVLNSFFHIFM